LKKDTRQHDFYIRLPEDKKRIKTELVKIAKENHITLTQLVAYIFEWFLEERKEKTFTIKLK